MNKLTAKKRKKGNKMECPKCLGHTKVIRSEETKDVDKIERIRVRLCEDCGELFYTQETFLFSVKNINQAKQTFKEVLKGGKTNIFE